MAIPFLNNINLDDNQLQNAKLHVTGSAPAAEAGQIYYNSTANEVRYYNGSDWVSLVASTGGTVTSVTSGNASTITIGGTATDPTVAANTAAVANGSANLATGDQIYDFVIGLGYITGNQTITLSGDVTGSGTTSITTTIAAGAVESGMLNNNVISGQTALTTGLASTDELLVSDAGTIKRMDVSVLEAYMQANLTFTNDTNTTYDFSLAAVSGNATVLTLDASTGDDDTVTFEGTTNEIQITTPATGDAGTVKIGLPDDVTIGNDLTVQGDLTVSGDTTTISTTNLNVEDALIGLQAELTGNNTNDIGLIMERGTTGDNAAFIWDESADKFTLGTTTATPASTGSITVTAGTLVAALEGNATTATTLANSRNFSITGDITAAAVSFNGSGNVVLNADIDANVVGAAELNVSGNGSNGQVLASDGDGTFSWVNQTADTNTQLATAAALIDVSAMGSNTTASFTHSLASKNLIVQLYDVTTGEVVFADIDHTSNNAISVIFASTPTNDIRVVVVDAKNGLTDKTVTYS